MTPSLPPSRPDLFQGSHEWLDLSLRHDYAQVMAVYFVLAGLILFAIAGGIWGVDSRPGFNGGSDDRKERFFFHSKID